VPHLTEVFRPADGAGRLLDPELAAHRRGNAIDDNRRAIERSATVARRARPVDVELRDERRRRRSVRGFAGGGGHRAMAAARRRTDMVAERRLLPGRDSLICRRGVHRAALVAVLGGRRGTSTADRFVRRPAAWEGHESMRRGPDCAGSARTARSLKAAWAGVAAVMLAAALGAAAAAGFGGGHAPAAPVIADGRHA
jgi:hypothetical protein